MFSVLRPVFCFPTEGDVTPDAYGSGTASCLTAVRKQGLPLWMAMPEMSLRDFRCSGSRVGYNQLWLGLRAIPLFEFSSSWRPDHLGCALLLLLTLQGV